MKCDCELDRQRADIVKYLRSQASKEDSEMIFASLYNAMANAIENHEDEDG